MNELEAHALIVEYLALAHGYGEAMWGRLDLWIGISSGLIVMSYFAPDRLTKPLTSLILGLYVAMTGFIFLNSSSDLGMAARVLQDALALAETQGISSEALIFKTTTTGIDTLTTIALAIFFMGMFIGTVGYVISMCLRNYKNKE